MGAGGLTRRRHLTPMARVALWHAQDERCANCRYPTKLGVMHADHMAPLWATADNSYDNYQLLCRHCHSAKTLREAGARAKTKRLEKVRLEGRKPKRSKIESRGFVGWRKFNGERVVRT